MKFLKRLINRVDRTIEIMILAGRHVNKYQNLRTWGASSYTSPSPHFIKQACILRNGLKGSTYIETGTYMGDTTALLSRVAERVISLEPEAKLYQLARSRFKDNENIEIMNGTSEELFPILIPRLRGDVSFWLDGHYSAGVTFQGAQDTPIIQELSGISKNLINLGKVVIMVDDIRCFDPTLEDYKDYPTRSYLVNWAEQNNFWWTIEHDIFIARN